MYIYAVRQQNVGRPNAMIRKVNKNRIKFSGKTVDKSREMS